MGTEISPQDKLIFDQLYGIRDPLRIDNTGTPNVTDLAFHVVRNIPAFERKFHLRPFFDPKREIHC